LGDSHDPRTTAEIKRKLAGAEVDFLFIDGDHSYDGVKADFELYSPLVRPEGVIALHDIVPGDEDNVGGVPTFWRELKERYETREIVEDWSQGSAGIGVIVRSSTARSSRS
jgi:predicted O-methyltransferase YrrM